MEKIIDILSNTMSKKRLQHTLGVVESAKKLAKIYGVDIERVRIAALLHDCAKNFDKEKIEEYIKKYDLIIDDVERNELQLIHGKIGACVAKYAFNIYDEEILSAIEYHTTGRENMTNLEKIIYLADFIEPHRDYPKVDDLRYVSYNESLNEGVLMAFDNTIKYIINMKKIIHPRTINARNYILDELNKMR